MKWNRYIEQHGWLRRLTNNGAFTYEEPTVIIPLSWLGLEDQEGNPIMAAMIAADYVAMQSIKATISSVHTEQLQCSLSMKRTKQANYLGHDYTDCDHCANCGAEQYEGDAYYGGCATAVGALRSLQRREVSE